MTQSLISHSDRGRIPSEPIAAISSPNQPLSMWQAILMVVRMAFSGRPIYLVECPPQEPLLQEQAREALKFTAVRQMPEALSVPMVPPARMAESLDSRLAELIDSKLWKFEFVDSELYSAKFSKVKLLISKLNGSWTLIRAEVEGERITLEDHKIFDRRHQLRWEAWYKICLADRRKKAIQAITDHLNKMDA